MRYDEYFHREPEESDTALRGMSSRGRELVAVDDGQIHPWARFWARSLDVLGFLLILTLAWPGWARSGPAGSSLFLSIVVLFAWTIPEAILLSVIGTTPGKWVMGLRVVSAHGQSLGLIDAWKRALAVWVRGLGAGIPVISLFTVLRAYATLNRDAETSWDAEQATGVRAAGRPAILRAISGVAALASLVVASIVISDTMETSGLRTEAVQSLSDYRADAERYLAEEGGSMLPVSDVNRGNLYAGGTTEFSFSSPVGEIAVVLGACDSDCLDLDLAILSPKGDTLDVDVETDALPVVSTRIAESGNHVAIVSMHRCDVEPCAFAAQVFQTSGSHSATSTGTCFAVSPAGLLITARHVVEGAKHVSVSFTDGRTGVAEVVAIGDEHDVALLQSNLRPPDYLSLRNSQDLRVGAYVFTLGFPATDLLGTEPKFTEGSISALSGIRNDRSLIQTSVPIQPGNSGGPLVDAAGEVVGVITATATARAFERATGALPQNVNWATKSGYASSLIGTPSARREPTETRQEAIARAYGSACFLDVELE